MENDFNDGNAGSAAVDKAHPLANFANFSADDLDSGGTASLKSTKAGEEKMSAVVEDGKEDAGSQQAASNQDDANKGSDGIKKTTDSPEEGLKKFDIPGTEKKEEGADAGGQQAALVAVEWGKVAQDFGFDIPQGTVVKDLNDVKALYTRKIEGLQQQAEANKQIVNKDEVYKQFAPEARQIVEFIDNGGELQDYLHPERIAQEYLALSSEDLMRAEYKELGIPEEKIDSHVTKLIENGVIDIEADKVRAGIVSATATQQQQILQQVNLVKQQKVATEQASENTKLNSIHEALGKTSEFLGGKIEQAHRDYVFNEFKSGRTKKLLEDPEVLSEFLLFNAFGKQAFGEIKKTEYSKGRESIEDNLFNTKPKLSQSSVDRRNQQAAPAKEGDFSSWDAVRQG